MTRTCDTCDRDELKARIAELESLLATRNQQNAACWTERDELRASLLELAQHIVFDEDGDLSLAEFRLMMERAGKALKGPA